MTSKKFLSNKKTAHQTISISPALKDWIERYVSVNQKKDPDDYRFRSISSFYTYVMEKSMEILEKGKTLEDFERFVDSDTRNFFDSITFRAVIPFHEELVRTHRYTNITFKQLPSLLFAIRKLYLDGIEPNDYESLQEKFEVLRKFYIQNKIVKEINLEIFTDGDRRYPTGIFECVGNYKNLFWENCKLNAAIFGIIGVKITDIIHSDKDLYCRFNLDTTDLIFRKDLAKKERIKLVNDNINLLINYKQILDDDGFYLWMKMAEDKGVIINFNNEKAQEKWTNLIIEELSKFGERENFLQDLLKFFEKLHWLDLENETELSFKIRISKDKNAPELQSLFSLLSKYSKITESDGKYYLNEI